MADQLSGRPRATDAPAERGGVRLPLVVALASVLLLAPSTSSTADAAGMFFDDDGSVHEAAIEGLAAGGVTSGCDPPRATRYCPDDRLTRGQAAALLRRALGIRFRDVDAFRDDDGSLFERDLDALAAAGVLRGCNPPANTRACPGRSLNRGEAAALIRRALDIPLRDVDAFRDDDRSVFERDLDALAAAGVLRGCDPPRNTLVCPRRPLTRAQSASVLVRALGDLTPLDPARLHDRVVTYEVRAFGGPTHGDLATLRLRAGEALTDPDGWSVGRRLLLQRVSSRGDLTLWLTDWRDVSERAPVCSDLYSCTVGTNVFLNDRNFARRPATFAGRSQADYQRYVILHEVGHVLGFDDTADASGNHYNDPRWCVGGRAPVMMQQTISTRGCRANPTPLPFEVDCVEEAWLRDSTDQGAECPHTERRR